MWTMHDWLSKEEGLCEYINHWKFMVLPKDDTVWATRLKRDGIFPIVVEAKGIFLAGNSLAGVCMITFVVNVRPAEPRDMSVT